MRRAIRLSLMTISFGCGLCALSLLMLPLLLALLMLLFDNTARGVMVLLGGIAAWLQPMLPGGGGALPAWRGIALDPASIAAAAAFRMAPCLAGLLFMVLAPAKPFAWGAGGLCWCLAALLDGETVAIVLSPGLAAALLLCCGVAAPRAADQRSGKRKN